jgi:Spy/CpxP family protein refolding chaperone
MSCDTVLELRKDTEALKQLADLEELVGVPPERGGYHFSDWEKQFIRDVREQHNRTLDFTEKQRAKIKDIWQASDLKKRVAPDEKVENLFSKLSHKRQAEMRERAKRVKLPWET